MPRKPAVVKAVVRRPRSHATNAYDLLNEVRTLILDEPKRYNQTIYLRRRQKPGQKGFPGCGTIGCVAGWVYTLKSRKRKSTDTDGVADEAAKILGISYDQRSLFSGEAANEAAGRHTKPQTRDHAKGGAAHIKAFQDEHEDQLRAKKL